MSTNSQLYFYFYFYCNCNYLLSALYSHVHVIST